MNGANTLENSLIEHCAPTLAGMKCGSLFNCRYAARAEVDKELERINEKLNRRGVYVEAMLWKESYVLIYAYRKTHLEKDLQREGVSELLQPYGYESTKMELCIEHLKGRLRDCDGFPHEIGVFLGYPLEDVKGFIVHKGQKCKYCGLWKVYCNECETRKLFEKLQKCTKVYLQVFAQGRSISQMTICA